MRAKKSLMILLGLLVAGGLIAAAGLLGAQRARAELMAQGQRQLQLMAPDLQQKLN